MIRNILHIVLLALATGVGCSPPVDDTAVATVNGNSIHKEEFSNRLRTYLTTTGVRDNILVRRSIVMNMIHERLIMEYASEQGWEEDAEGLSRMREIESQALLDAYAKSLMNEVTVGEKELLEEFRIRNTRVSARYVYAHTREDALRLKKRLERGEAFGDLAREVFDDPGLADNGGFVGYFGPGDMDEDFEEAAFNLPVGTISDPVRIRAGYAVLRVEDKKSLPLQSETDYARLKHELEAAVRSRKSRELLEQTAEQLSASETARWNEGLLEKTYEMWKSLKVIPDSEVSKGLLQDSASVMVSSSATWTVSRILSELETLSQRQQRNIKTVSDLRKAILGLQARKRLVLLAREQGFGEKPEVLAQRENVWRHAVLKRWKARIEHGVETTGVTEDEVKREFTANPGVHMIPPEVSVKEILVREKELAERLLSEIRNDKDFSRLAEKFSVRRSSARRGGNLGFGTRATFGALSEKFFSASDGAVIGPERVDPYWGVFMVTGRRAGRAKTFEEAREEIEKTLLLRKKQQAIERALEDLRNEASYSIDEASMMNVTVDYGSSL